MADLKLEVDVEAIAKSFGDLRRSIENDITKGVESLAVMTHAKTLELARDNLRSLSQLYMDNVEFSNPAPNFWVVTLKEAALWIEEGRKSGFMQELLDGKSGKVSAKGEKYAVIPFKHNVNPTEQSTKAQQLSNEIREGHQQRDVGWRKIELNRDGSPRLGMLHKFNVESARLDPKHKTPSGYGVTVYQTKQKDGSVRRDIMTFRVITEKHKNEGLWNHPGRDGDHLMDKAFDWAIQTWEKDILPAIIAKHNQGQG